MSDERLEFIDQLHVIVSKRIAPIERKISDLITVAVEQLMKAENLDYISALDAVRNIVVEHAADQDRGINYCFPRSN